MRVSQVAPHPQADRAKDSVRCEVRHRRAVQFRQGSASAGPDRVRQVALVVWQQRVAWPMSVAS